MRKLMLVAGTAFLVGACDITPTDPSVHEFGAPVELIQVQAAAAHPATVPTTARAGSTFPITYRAIDAEGRGVPGASVTISVTEGDGAIFNPATNSWVRERTLTTDQITGRVPTTTWRVDPRAGAETEFTVSADWLASDITYTVVSTLGPPETFTLESGDDQTGTPGEPLAEPIVVFVGDAAGNPIEGDTVTFTFEDEDGEDDEYVTVTDEDGLAEFTWTIHRSGDHEMTVESTAGELTVTAFGEIGPPTQVIILEGDGVEASPGDVIDVTAQAADQYGTPVPGAFFMFTPELGSVSPRLITAGEDGTAATRWTLGETSGTQRLHVQAASDDNTYHGAHAVVTATVSDDE
jgi:hypothetical protein